MPVSRATAVQFGAASDTGRARTHNEDRFQADPRLGLFAVVDGVGGQNAGEVASESVVRSLQKFIEDTDDDDEKTWPFGIDPHLSDDGNRLRVAVLIANHALAERIAQDGGLAGMAATMSALLLNPPRAVVANVGDCRAYLFRDGVFTQITTDHSWVAEQIQLGLLDPLVARTHPMRNVVTRAVSGDERLEIDIVEFELKPGSAVLLCSDGLPSMLTDDEIQRCLVESLPDVEAACRRLVEAANAAGGQDNITALIVRIPALPPSESDTATVESSR